MRYAKDHKLRTRNRIIENASYGLRFAMARTTAGWAELAEKRPFAERFDIIVDHYLSAGHRDNLENGCALPALGADIGRSSPIARRVVEKELERLIDLARQLPNASARQIATGAVATMVGSIVLSRAVGGSELADEILEAGRNAVGRRVSI